MVVRALLEERFDPRQSRATYAEKLDEAAAHDWAMAVGVDLDDLRCFDPFGSISTTAAPNLVQVNVCPRKRQQPARLPYLSRHYDGIA